MNILLLSNPTPNNVLATKLAASHQCTHLFIQANHPYQITAGTTVSINVNDSFEVEAFCIAHKINMMVIHQTQLLQNGLFNFFNNEQREWKGIVIGCNKIEFTNQSSNLSTNQSIPIITDGTNYFPLVNVNITAFDPLIKNKLQSFKQQSIAVNGFLEFEFEQKESTYFVANILPCLQNEETVLQNLETDLTSVFVAIYNGTFDDVNVEFSV